jgi:hypothetical protein
VQPYSEEKPRRELELRLNDLDRKLSAIVDKLGIVFEQPVSSSKSLRLHER